MCSDNDGPSRRPPAREDQRARSPRRTAHNRGLSRIGDVADEFLARRVGGEVLSEQVCGIDGPLTCDRGALPGLGWRPCRPAAPRAAAQTRSRRHGRLGPPVRPRNRTHARVPVELVVGRRCFSVNCAVAAFALARALGQPPVVALAREAEPGAHERDRVQLVRRPSPRSPRTSRLFFREPGCFFFCEITLHPQDCVLFAESFQFDRRSRTGPCRSSSGIPCVLHPLAYSHLVDADTLRYFGD